MQMAHGGWTSTRHYAVPTTDLPVHAIPSVARWFTSLLTGRLAPLLGKHFGVNPSALRVHDAFVVRYRARAQAHLPFHADESLLSLTLPLNVNAEFVGGGTYFGALGRALRPEKGHVVAFDGALLHGGEPIVQGTVRPPHTHTHSHSSYGNW